MFFLKLCFNFNTCFDNGNMKVAEYNTSEIHISSGYTVSAYVMSSRYYKKSYNKSTNEKHSCKIFRFNQIIIFRQN